MYLPKYYWKQVDPVLKFAQIPTEVWDLKAEGRIRFPDRAP